MPKLQKSNLPPTVVSHLQQRVYERRITLADLGRLRDWVNSDPDLPDGDWYKDFGSFVLAGSGPWPSTVLTPEMRALGEKLP